MFRHAGEDVLRLGETEAGEGGVVAVLDELFSVIGGFSGYRRPAAERLLADLAKANPDYQIIFIGSGTEDRAVIGGRSLHEAFAKKGVKHIWSEDPGYGHNYQIWRIYLHRLLQQTFRD